MRNGDGGEAPALRDEEQTSGQLVGKAGFPSSRLRKSPKIGITEKIGIKNSKKRVKKLSVG
jgi:hypothetical protein